MHFNSFETLNPTRLALYQWLELVFNEKHIHRLQVQLVLGVLVYLDQQIFTYITNPNQQQAEYKLSFYYIQKNPLQNFIVYIYI